MRHLRIFLQVLLAIIAVAYTVLIFALDNTRVQEYIAHKMATNVSELIGGNVEIDHVNIGLFNSIELHDVTLHDKQDEVLIKSDLVYVKISIAPLFSGKVKLRNISILDADIHLYRETPESPINYQFIIDAFKTNKKKKPLNLAINSLLLRRCSLTYDVRSLPYPADNRFCANHIVADDINTNLSLKISNNKDLSLRIRQLQAREQSGLQINNLRTYLVADDSHAVISNFLLELPKSHLFIKEVNASYDASAPKQIAQSLTLQTEISDFLLSSSDLIPFEPRLANIDQQMSLRTALSYKNRTILFDGLKIATTDHLLNLDADLLARFGETRTFSIQSEIQQLSLKQDLTQNIFKALSPNKDVPSALLAVGDINIIGKGNFSNVLSAPQASFDGQCTTNAGQLTAKVSLKDFVVDATVESKDFSPAIFFSKDASGVGAKLCPTLADFTLKAKALLTKKTRNDSNNPLILKSFESDIDLRSVTIQNSIYQHINASVAYDNQKARFDVTTNDEALKMNASVNALINAQKPFDIPQNLSFDATIDCLSPSRLQLTNRYGDGVFSMRTSADFNHIDVKNLDLTSGNILIEDFTVSGDKDYEDPYQLQKFSIRTSPMAYGNHVRLRSDFADLDYSGPLSPERLKEIATNLYHSIEHGSYTDDTSDKSKDISDKDKDISDKDKDIFDRDKDILSHHLNMALMVKDVAPFERLAGIKLHQEGGIQSQLSATEDGKNLTFSIYAPKLAWGKFALSDLSIYARNRQGAFNVLGKMCKKMKNGEIQAEMTAVNRDGRICTDIEWDEVLHHAFYGKLSAATSVDITEHGGKKDVAVTTDFLPSTLCIGDTLWNVVKSQLNYQDKRLSINNFGIFNDKQGLYINGNYDRSSSDTIVVSLNNVNLEYALAFARLNVVDFAGHATGKVVVQQLPNGNPWAKAQIHIPDFEFNHTPFGTADVGLEWDHKERDIVITGDIVEQGIGSTRVRGYVDPVNRDLDLYTESDHTPLGFLNKYTSGIFEDVEGRATGNCRIFGSFRTIDFIGHEEAECQATIPITGVRYSISDAVVDIEPGTFLFRDGTITDAIRGQGLVQGALRHQHIKNLTYDFELSGRNLLMYNKPRELDMPFFATASGTGNVHLYGSPGKMNADIRISTTPGSELTYVLDSPDAVASQLLTLQSSPEETDIFTASGLTPQKELGQAAEKTQQSPVPSAASQAGNSTDINLYFEVDVDDQSSLHLITDDKSGDVITVYGSGPIQATYHNKSGFQMFGTYNIKDGSYGLNIPMLAQRKKFNILSGGKVQFSGDPKEAEVNVKAQYVVNSASLADLNLGTGFANNTTRVNCLVNIYGEVANMQFDLDFELPNCSEDEQQMVRNLIATDEDRTRQVLYLLGVGRFYAYNYSSNEIGQSQSVLMMNSLLSSTLSSQLNNIISNAVGSNAWTFGTNISTGQMGWSDMEIEGMVSSRLLNNRLLINGNFGYSDRQAATTNFVGDFDMQYLITPKGTVSVRAYSETNDRYFTKSSLTTQGIGLQLKRDFTRFRHLFRRKHNKNKTKKR